MIELIAFVKQLLSIAIGTLTQTTIQVILILL